MSKTIEIVVPPPHSATQELIMNGLITPHLREVVVSCGTKYGKSISAASALVLAAPRRHQALFRWVSPIYSQSKIGFKYCSRILPGRPYVTANLSSLSLFMPDLDTTIQYFHGQNSGSIEGEAVAGYVLDECAKLDYDIYASAKTTTTVTRGPMIMCSTPSGKNWFYKKFLEARDEMDRAKFEGRPPQMIAITAPTSDNPHVPRDTIEFAKRTLPDRLYKQFYEAAFLDDGSVFLGIEACLFGEPINCYGRRERWITPDAKLHDVIIGVDWAKSVDFTVFIAISQTTKAIVGFERFNRETYQSAVKRLYSFCKTFKDIVTIAHDKTGVGVAIDEMVQGLPYPSAGITFTNSLKTSMVSSLIVAIENQEIAIPRWATLLEELEFYEVRTNAVGMLFYAAQSGRHDDTIAALLLAWYGTQQMSSSMEVIYTDTPQTDNIYSMTYGDDDDDD